jgi:hypothetical protein
MGDLQRFLGYSAGAKWPVDIFNPLTIASVAATQYYEFNFQLYWHEAQLIKKKEP